MKFAIFELDASVDAPLILEITHAALLYLTPTGKSCTGLCTESVRLFVYPPQLNPFPPVFTPLYSGSVKGLSR